MKNINFINKTKIKFYINKNPMSVNIYTANFKVIPRDFTMKSEKIADAIRSKDILFEGKRPFFMKTPRANMTISTKPLFQSLQNFHKYTPKIFNNSIPTSRNSLDLKKKKSLNRFNNLGDQLKLWPFQENDIIEPKDHQGIFKTVLKF